MIDALRDWSCGFEVWPTDVVPKGEVWVCDKGGNPLPKGDTLRAAVLRMHPTTLAELEAAMEARADD